MPFRAVEEGFSLVRATSQGISQAVDPYGRVLASLDYFAAPGESLSVTVPVGAVPTIYSRFGDVFGWVATAGLALLVLAALRGRALRVGVAT